MRKTKSLPSILFAMALLLAGLFMTPQSVFAEETTPASGEQETTEIKTQVETTVKVIREKKKIYLMKK